MNSQLSHGMHTKTNLDKAEKKSYRGSKLIYDNKFTIKKSRKNNALG